MGTHWKYHLRCVDGGRSPSFFAKKWRGSTLKTGGGRPGKEKYFSHIHIFQTNIHMYNNKDALINYCFIPFQ